MPALIFPPEICSLICTSPLLSRSDLHALCHVSRSFRTEAERILYTSIDIPTPSRRSLMSWCTSVTRRPHLASRTTTLSLTMPAQMSLQADDLSRLKNALHLCVNLRNLSMLDGEPRFSGDAVQVWIIQGHSFTLDKFTNTYFSPNSVLYFLETQPSLTRLSLRSSATTQILGKLQLFHEETLPNLTTLDTSAAIVRELARMSSKPWKNLKRLQYFIKTDEDELATFRGLSSFGPLDILSIERQEIFHMELGFIASWVAAEVPNLKYLRIMDYTHVVVSLLHKKSFTNKNHLQGRTYASFLSLPMHFNHIQTLIIKPGTFIPSPDSPDPVCAYPELLQYAERLEAAKRVMNDLPTLELLVLMLPERNFGFTREGEGAAVVQNEVEVDDDAWMDVQVTVDVE
ncbi:hypothetical protein K443DRAFT_332773 [Laccaria amethystina LaAM-08-1]|uniref:F-box domain-containing protein n=1 Tax=Laccaria amethystina LaAM-08-1 TaxID=1095629 RepID=A0A0C9X1R7_9AGAR|nr:hypothetical protein K443DRAFT_332773 [Laccaria amethystina LaAM-08-1]